MQVKDFDNLRERVKSHLKEYLEEHDTEFTGSHFTCPNRAEHKNDDGKPSAAFYKGPDAFKCFSCFKEDAPVFTNKGVVPISEIKLGDKVLSLDGKFHKVVNLFKKEYEGDFIKVNATLPGHIDSTNYHNIYYIDKNCQDLYYRDYSINKKPAKELEVGDYLITPIPQFIDVIKDGYINLDNYKTNSKHKLNIKIDEDFCKFLGLFIAEGNINGDRSVCLTFHKEEQELINFIIEFAKRYNLNATPHYKKESKACTVIICNTKLAKWLQYNCGNTSKNKRIPHNFLGLESSLVKSIINGIYLGDGHVLNSRVDVLTTISKTLAHQVYLLCIKFHYYPSVSIAKEHIAKRDGILRQQAYSITKRSDKLNSGRISHKIYKTGGFYLKTNEGEVYCKRIRKLDTYKEKTHVYNIEVEDTHNYNINGITVANCETCGDIFTAAHHLEGRPIKGREFVQDNVLYLADMFGEEYDIRDRTDDEIKKDKLYKALEDTCMLACNVLKADSPKLDKVKKYISDRGWDDLVDQFDFGYCSYEKLIDVLKKKGHDEDTLMEVGLIPPRDAKGQYEKYLLDDRLVFPIRNSYGKTVAFGSRLLRPPKNDKEQKYLQSRNTCLYNKNNTLFNLDNARASNKVYIVEGYADVFTLFNNEVDNVVALCGLSFNETKYKLLVQNQIQQIVFCLDNDGAGKNALNRIIDKELKNLKGIDVFVKVFPENCKEKDVDEFISNHGIDAFNELPELSVFEFKLEQLKKNTTDTIVKNDIIKILVDVDDFTAKESMANTLASVIGASNEAVKKEIDRHSRLEKGNQLTTSEDILEEMNCFERVVNDWDRLLWSRTGELLGLKADKFPHFVKHMDGIQNMFYLIAGDTNIGKSALLLNMTTSLLNSNDDIFVLFFSVDDTLSQLLPRLIALDKNIAINTVSNPKFKIQYNDSLNSEVKEKLILARQESIDKLKNMSDRFAMKEESQASTIEDINKYIQIYKKIAGTKQLVVIVDNLHRITSKQKMDTRELYMEVSNSLKKWKVEYDIPVIATAEIRKAPHKGARPDKDDIKECKDLQFDADLVALLYSDFFTNKSTNLKFNTEENLPEGEDASRPIVEMNVVKNKTSVFKKRIYYKFYPEYSKYVECSKEDIDTLFRQYGDT